MADGVQRGRRATDSLFFALHPDAAAAIRLTEQAARLRIDHALKARAIPVDRLHITLHYLGAFDGLPVDILERAKSVAESIAAGPADIALDRVESFAGHRARHPLVLAGDASESLVELEQTLGKALDAAGIETKRHPHFTPHVTLFYDERRIAREAVQPVTWTATEFALIRSFLGQSRYEILARWPLGA